MPSTPESEETRPHEIAQVKRSMGSHTCGHERDEHRNSNHGASECEVDDCPCIQFESDE